ncbi:RagB/SusD family nutrient uptake outer membrane protein [Proteiniphilum sp.]|uniref:RagB/SusD family nutrient uptake outer membrane protein n=1 Tax=Proteiniphilum sp. TaxID=1926877 RepID=UPI002B204EE4|nr:RagB/SusD family nutrient uptake outer membrane protein [Proteiniphilum sp.]MEA4917210.1 RagB/SusD family nutrient uptake outer membrane protein [Proteiniphilum sp.]
MKRSYIIFFVFCIIGFGFKSCDYLDIVPDNVATIDYAFRNRTEAEKFLFTCYSYRPPIGSVNTDPALNGCDETWQRYESGGWPNWNNSLIARGYQSLTNPILNFWDGENAGKPLWIGIRDCNIFLENIGKVYDITEYERTRWIAEVKFLKAYYHFYLFMCYGPIPIVDENLPVFAETDEAKVYREPVDTVVQYITNLMAEAAGDLPDVDEVIEGTEAGRIDKLGALGMRARILLFAASPLLNGNKDYASLIDNRGLQLFPQEYDENKWKLAADACKEVIDACHSQHKELYDLIDPQVLLSPEPFKLQTTYRQAICDRWNKELIWGSTNNDQDFLARQAHARILRLSSETLGNVTSQWAPTLKIVEAYYSSNGVPIDEDIQWLNNGWYENRHKIREEASSGDEKYYVKEGEKTVYLHYNREPRFYASVGFDKGIYFGSGYYSFPSNVKHCDFLNLGHSGFQGGSGYSITGYSAKKMHSFKDALTATSYSIEYYPFPILRLADLYLMYAEALNEVEGPSEEIYYYLDLIRKRAGLEGVKESWLKYSSIPNKPDTKEGLRQIIHRERMIELAFEGKRFWDLRRWKEISELNNQPRGWNIMGETPEDFYQIVTVAKVPVKFTIKDYFWPIKESNLSVNKNLIQNYGW